MGQFNTLTIDTDAGAADHEAYLAAYRNAKLRALHSFFPQQILYTPETGYRTIDEGDYGTLPPHIIDQIVDTVPAAISDELW